MLPALSNTNTTHRMHLDNSNAQISPSEPSTPKRTSSMIFRIEHLLPPPPPPRTPPQTPTPTPATRATPTSIAPPTTVPSESISTTAYQLQTTTNTSISATIASSNNSTRRSKSNRASGVYLKNFGPKDTVSETISTMLLMSTNSSSGETTEQQRAQQSTRTYCSIMQDVLRITPSVMRRIKLSEDIHSYNAVFEIYNGDVRLRTVRDIARDEELIAWFDEEVTLLMSIPFLTPMNIQGNNRYTCHICNLTFETPNPLKIHLALACGRHTLDILWIRLHYTLKSTSFTHQSLPLRLMHHLPAISPAHCSPVQISSSSATIPTISMVGSKDSHRFSAFKPIQSSSSTVSSSTSNILPISTAALSLPLTSHSTTSISYMPTISTATNLTPMSLLQPPNSNPLNAAAQIEAIVSNMGASKQGHLCIYCGKVYSRKYGLKIHIRTHTGFKPLKCKFCLRPFGDPSNLNKHVRLHLQSSAASSSSGETVEGFKCHMCHKTLARRRDLQRHIESRHNTTSS